MRKSSQIGPYHLLGELGRGRHATVYKAKRHDAEGLVALKVLRDYDQATLDKFNCEVDLSKSLNIPGVRRTYEAGQTREGFIFLAMEYVDASLKDVMRRQNHPFTRDEVVSLLDPIAQALDRIHQQGLVHLDIKPENILVFKDGRAVLADFGITRQEGETTTEGTPRYMSPEQVTGASPINAQSDVYALGMVIYEMLTGQPAFQGDRDDVLLRQHVEDIPPSPRALNPQVDRAVARTILAAVSKTPHLRPISAGALLHELKAAHSTPIDVVMDVVREQPLTLFPAVAVVVVMVLMGVGMLRNESPSASPSITPVVETPSVTVTATATALAPVASPAEADLEPTSTPRPHTPTPTYVPWTPPVAPPEGATPATNNAPRLLSPSNDSDVTLSPSGDSDVTNTHVEFRWSWHELLSPSQKFVVILIHTDTGQEVRCEAGVTTCVVQLPAKNGVWQWTVTVSPNGPTSDPFYFHLKVILK